MAGIYIHIPFCKQACHYCDFHFSTSMKNKDAMVSALQNELMLRKNEFKNDVIETIYFGGGTPSLLTIDELRSLIDSVYKNYDVAETPEITLEANPDDLASAPFGSAQGPGPDSSRLTSVAWRSQMVAERSRSYRDIGINRLSIGIQSFFEEDLKLMNRAHNAKDVEACLREAIKHFDNISIDLIYGIPGMGNERWKQNIDMALSFGIPHISSYALTVEPKTALAHMIKNEKVADVDDESAQEQFHMLVDCLEKEGFINYEISNFGREGFFSKNNTAYWKGKKYMGIGPSAHSFDGKQRGWNVRNNSKYIRAIQEKRLPMETEILSKNDRYNEYIMTGLRTIWGVSLEKIHAQFGRRYADYLIIQSEKYIDQYLLSLDQDVLSTTKKGKFLVDGIASDLFILN